jgi:hypothetical protein
VGGSGQIEGNGTVRITEDFLAFRVNRPLDSVHLPHTHQRPPTISYGASGPLFASPLI